MQIWRQRGSGGFLRKERWTSRSSHLPLSVSQTLKLSSVNRDARTNTELPDEFSLRLSPPWDLWTFPRINSYLWKWRCASTQQMGAIPRSIYLPVVLSLERSCYELREQGLYKQNFFPAHPVTSDGLYVGAGLSSNSGWSVETEMARCK